MHGSWWRVLTNTVHLEKGMANRVSILALRTPRTARKGKQDLGIGMHTMAEAGDTVKLALYRCTAGEAHLKYT